ncbi:hypothetical protein [Nocardiopsis alborubida]|uniref:Uncharacterized protein n=1 Tax=Nocardiopsis alborubida TaxID=146802 RepID=A0A7X6MEW5_9ACTN|nr:hypothetical protein [Nocardiopsis alborubida]NKY99512.1 hypothetical protein [Nocardiopsis alborubida]
MTLAILVAVAVTVAVVVDTLAPMGSRSGLGVRRGAARRALTALRRGPRPTHAPAQAVTVEDTPGNRVPEPRREIEPAGLGIAATPSPARRAWNGSPARAGRPRRAAAKASLT